MMSSNYDDSGLQQSSTPESRFLAGRDLPTSKLANYGMDEETPIFRKREVLLRTPQQYTGAILHLAVSRNWLFCIRAAPPQTALLRFFLPKTVAPTEIPLEKYLAGYKISKLFVDHTGHHLLISILPKSAGLSADFLYIQGDTTAKVRRIEKFKDHEITTVGFNSYIGTESCTGPILLGTSRGLIFETELLQEAEKPSFRKQVYDLGLGRPKYPILGLELLKIRGSSKYCVVAAGPDCIYTFYETLKADDKISLQSIFTPYVNGLRAPLTKQEDGEFHYSTLRFFSQPTDKYATQWGWLCAMGIHTGEVSLEYSRDEILLCDKLIKLDFIGKTHLSYEERRQVLPKSFVLTEFHALLLYPDHITAINLLDHEVIYEEYFTEESGELLHFAQDPFTGFIYLCTDKMIFRYEISDEQRNIWEIHLRHLNFEKAKIFAAKNPFQLAVVVTKEAEVAFDECKYELAAQLYAETECTFEETCLKFMELPDKRPIIAYIKKCLKKLDADNYDQIKALVLWLIDIYLVEINFPGRQQEERQQWQREFDEFMRQPVVSACTRTNYPDVYGLISQHADCHNLSQLAIANEDYATVLDQYFDTKNYVEALGVLRSQKDPELFYKYCPVLMQEMPQATVEILIAQGRKLRIERLIPTIIAIDSPKHVDEIIKYLEHSIYNLSECNEAVHNFLLRLYAEHRPEKLLAYLENEGHDISLVHYEANYALSVCTEFKVKIGSVFLQCLLEMWSAAVELALTFNIQLAKETASKPKDEVMRRKLWLRIAYNEIQDTNDVKKALALLKECELLRIEDLLPLFSDFEKIDDFKEPICSALQEYNQKMQELQNDMDESSKQADRVRGELQSIRERCIRIEAQEPCSICESFLLVKPFFVFPCGHKFHSDCLEKQVTPMLSNDKSRKLTMLKQQLESMLTQSIAMAENCQQQQRKRAKIKSEVEEILASDCLFCEHMIETVDQPFCEDWDQVNVDWE